MWERTISRTRGDKKSAVLTWDPFLSSEACNLSGNWGPQTISVAAGCAAGIPGLRIWGDIVLMSRSAGAMEKSLHRPSDHSWLALRWIDPGRFPVSLQVQATFTLHHWLWFECPSSDKDHLQAVQLVWIGVCVWEFWHNVNQTWRKISSVMDSYQSSFDLSIFIPCILAQSLHVQGLFISITHFGPFAGDARHLSVIMACHDICWCRTESAASEMHALLWRDLNTWSKNAKNKVTRTIHKAPPEDRKSPHVIIL